jgi:hypothetical protein
MKVHRFFSAILLLSIVLASGCASTDLNTAGIDKEEYEVFTKSRVSDPDDLLVVDCLLPGQVRKLGTAVYLTPRRAIKTTARMCEIRGGEYISYDRADLATALSIWLPQAQEGDPKAQTYVGEMYERGLGTAPDYQKAAQWYRMGAEQGYARAKINLGNLYEQGLGVPKDTAAALTLYRSASGLSEELVLADQAISKEEIEELSRLRREVSASSKEKEDLKKELQANRQQLEAALRELEQGRKRLEKERQDLLVQKKTLPKDEDGQARTRELERLLVSREAKLADLQRKVEQLSRKGVILRNETGESGADVAVGQPSIRIIEPVRQLATRGVNIVEASQNVSAQEVVGKVDCPAGLYRLTLNDLELKTKGDGFFRVSVPVLDPGDPPLRFTAVDNLGRSAKVDFVLSGNPGAAIREMAKQGGHLPINEPPDVKVNFGEYYALIIGNNNYQHFPKLKTAVRDAQDVADLLLKRYGFQTTVLADVGRLEILSALHHFGSSLPENANLLIYYAGHGELDQVNNRGFWIPVDGEKDNRANWLSTESLTDLLNLMKVRRILVVADSCYSGILSASLVADVNSRSEMEKRLAEISRKRSRTVLTSGGLKPVLDAGGDDNSVFAEAFLGLLQANYDVLEGKRLAQEVNARVAFMSEKLGMRQDPSYGALRHAGHEAGDFFFLPRK